MNTADPLFWLALASVMGGLIAFVHYSIAAVVHTGTLVAGVLRGRRAHHARHHAREQEAHARYFGGGSTLEEPSRDAR